LRSETHSYRLAEELINSKLDLKREIVSVVKEVTATQHIHGKKKQFLYSERQLNNDFEKGFCNRGWMRNVKVIQDLDLKTDFRKSRVQVEVQFGNASRFYADVMKFQLSYLQDEVDLGVEILAKQIFAKFLNSNIANYERAVREIDKFKFAITLPIWIIGIEP
jgi:hypothetical protein